MKIPSFKEFLNEEDNNFLFEMANLWPDETGLNEVIWISVQNANHGPRIKIFEGKTAIGKNFSVTIEDEPKVVGTCFVSNRELENIKKFITINKVNLIRYWNYQISTKEVASNILKV